MDLIFRSMSHAAGVEIPANHYLPWEKAKQSSSVRPGLYQGSTLGLRKKAVSIFGKALGLLGHRLVRAGGALVSS